VGVGLVCQHPPDPHTLPVDVDVADVVQQREQLRVVPGLARGQDHRQRQAGGIDR